MPGFLLAFWIGMGSVLGSVLLHDYPHPWSPVDPTSHSNLGKTTPSVRYATSSPLWTAYARRDLRGRLACRFALFAYSTQGKVVRLVLDGQEQELGTAWTQNLVVDEGTNDTISFVWIDPVTHKVLTTQMMTLYCRRNPGFNYGELYNSDGTLRGY
jgi:hypothetical protein